MYFVMDSDAHSDSSSSLDESAESGDENDFSDSCCFKQRVLQLPECFCSEEEVFKEVLNPTTWKSVFNSKNGERLKRYLPLFPDDDENEKINTLKKLFDGENFKFGSPFKHFFSKLKDGFFSSDIAEITNALKRANYKEYRSQLQQYSYHILHNILVSRKKLLDASYTLPPGTSVKMQQFIAKPKDATLSERTRLRYFSILQDIRDETGDLDTSSEDENYPESNVSKVPKKYKKQMQMYESSLNPEMTRITSTTTFPHGYPCPGNFLNHSVDMFEVSEERYREMLMTHKERMSLDPLHPELDISHIDLKDITARSNFAKRSANKTIENPAKKKIKISENSERLANSVLTRDSAESESSPSLSSLFHREESSFNSSGADTVSDIIAPSVQETEVQTDPLSILDEGEDSQIFENQQPTRIPSPHPDTQQHPTCFFALLRDIFCESVEQKLSAVKLEEKVRNWQGGVTASLFDWLNFQESWSDLVSSALKFLAGDLISILPDTFVPFLDYKEKQQQWQWIGSGRDSDEQMYGLCQQWLENKDEISSDVLESSQGSLPPPRVTTGWTVRPTAEEEKRVYREQECIRYQNPHKAFTFKVHGYEAVVGPVKGVYGKESGINKAREHSLLTSDRPPFVTILSLVRDSAARLPNGEGTRADICELLKDSQYLAPASDQQIHTVVSGALDRLHYEKDPCVKYDVNRKLWIYLHRHRTEEEFERIHQAQAAAAKARKAVQKSKLPKIRKEPVHTTASVHVANQENIATLNVDIPSTTTSAAASQSPRGGSSPRAQGSPKSNQTVNRFVVHTAAQPSQPEVKCSVLGVDPQSKTEPARTDVRATSCVSSTSMTDSAQQTVSPSITTEVQEVNNPRQPILGSSMSVIPNTKNIIGNVTATQIVSVTPIQIKSCPTEQVRTVCSLPSHVQDVLNVDMKPSSPSFVGQPPVLQPILSHPAVENSNSLNISSSVTPNLISSTCASVTKAKVNCANLSSLQTSIAGFQTIVIKQEPGLRPCSGVSAIPLLSIEERLPSANPSAVSSGPVVARLVHGSQYLSFSNILASSTTCSPSKPIAGALQNFRVHGGNICQQVLSTSTIKVMHSAPVSAITDSRLPVIALKNQLNSGKEPSLISQTPASLNVCGRLYQMANVRNTAIAKDIAEAKALDVVSSKEGPETLDKETKDVIVPVLSLPTTSYVTIPALSISTTSYGGPVSIANKNIQTVFKVSPK